MRRDAGKRFLYPSIFLLIGIVRGALEVGLLVRKYPLATSVWNHLLFVIVVIVGSSGLFSVAYGLFILLCRLRKNSGRTPALILGLLGGFLLTDGSRLLWSQPAVTIKQVRESRPESRFERPSVLLISVDTLRADRLSCYGHNRTTTPFLDRLSKRARLYANATTTVPATTPAHVSLMTGLEPLGHGSRFNAVRVGEQVPLLAELFRDAGYKTAAFVSAFPVTEGVSGLARGFHLFNEFLAPDRGPQWLYLSSLTRSLWGLNLIRPAERKADMLLEHALPWLRTQSADDFFLWCHVYDPHLPYDPPVPYNTFYTNSGEPVIPVSVKTAQDLDTAALAIEQVDVDNALAAYDGEIAFVDRILERLVYEARAVCPNRELLVVVTADHGESLVEHEYFFAHSRNLYQPSLAIPLIVFQSTDSEPLIYELPWSIIDVAPELVSLCSLGANPLHRGLPDRSLDSEGNVLIFAENAEGVYIQAHRPNPEKLTTKIKAVTSWPWKYISNPDGSVELYNLEVDPQELINHAAEFQSLASALEQTLLTRFETQLESGQNLELDEEALSRLRTLGYIAP